MTRVVAKRDDGPDIDVTEAVRVLYGLVRQSMDWGSGFLCVEEVIETTRLAEVCGFIDLPGGRDQVEAYLKKGATSHLGGTCGVCNARVTFKIGEVTERGRYVVFSCGHVGELVQPADKPAEIIWPKAGV